MCVLSGSAMSDSVWPHGLQPARLPCPWNLPDKNAGVGCHFLLQGSFLTQGLNLCLLHRQPASLPLSHLQSPSSYHTILIFFMTSKLALVFHFNSYLPRPKNFIFLLSYCEQKISSWFLSSWPFSPLPCLNFHFIIWIYLFRRNETFSSFGSRYSKKKKKSLHSFDKDLAYLFTYLSQEMLVIMYPKTELRWMEMQKKMKKPNFAFSFWQNSLSLGPLQACWYVCVLGGGLLVERNLPAQGLFSQVSLNSWSSEWPTQDVHLWMITHITLAIKT